MCYLFIINIEKRRSKPKKGGVKLKFKTARRWAAVVMILILLFSNLSGALYAEETVEEDTTEQTVGEETTDEEEGIMPCDIIYNQEIFAVLNRNVTVYCAPYEWGNASSGYTLSAGQGVFVIGREYECFLYIGISAIERCMDISRFLR